MAESSYKGHHTRTRGKRRTYQFDVMWFPSGNGLFWSAIVRYKGEIVGRPWGTFAETPNTYVDGLVRAAVAESIERCENVRE